MKALALIALAAVLVVLMGKAFEAAERNAGLRE